MQSVLAMIIIFGLVIGAGIGATYEVRKMARRLDTGQVIQADPTVQVADTNITCVDLKLISTSFIWIAIPMSPHESTVTATRVIHPVVIIYADLSLSLTSDEHWQTVALSEIVPCGPDGVPLDWNYQSGDIPATVPVDVLRSSNMVDWDYIATAQAPGQYRDVDSDMRQGQNFYQVRLP